MEGQEIKRAFVDSPIGPIELAATATGLCGLRFADKMGESEQSTILDAAIKQLQEYLNRERKEFDLPIDMDGTSFQKKVWQELLKIPYGDKCSYLDISNRLNDRNLTRAVGNANGQNKIAIVIPCHRVIGSDGSLTGFASGIHRKKWLLDLEATDLQLSLF